MHDVGKWGMRKVVKIKCVKIIFDGLKSVNLNVASYSVVHAAASM